MSEPEESDECSMCHKTMLTDDGCEPTDICHNCAHERIATLEAQNQQLAVALSESLKLQRHYAELINMHDGGERRLFNGSAEWIERLIETGTLAATDKKP